jgi:hypothetical protein
LLADVLMGNQKFSKNQWVIITPAINILYSCLGSYVYYFNTHSVLALLDFFGIDVGVYLAWINVCGPSVSPCY